MTEEERGRQVGVRRAALAAETLRLYASDWGGFSAFCANRGVGSLPATSADVIAFLSQPGGGRAARGRRLAAIDHRHRQLGLPAPGDDAEVRATLRQVRKSLPARTRSPAPSDAALRAMAQRCPGDLAGRRDRAVLLLLATGLGRRAVVALQAERIRFSEAGLTVGDGAVMVPRGAAGACPVRAVEEWLLASATRYGPVFRKINRWGTLETAALGADAVRLILARRAAA